MMSNDPRTKNKKKMLRKQRKDCGFLLILLKKVLLKAMDKRSDFIED